MIVVQSFIEQQLNIYFLIILFIYFYFWLHWVFVAMHRLSLIAASWHYSSLQFTGLSLQRLLLLWSTGSRAWGLSICELQDLEHRLQRRQWHPTPVLLPGKSHGWRSLEGCSPWGRWGSDTTEHLHFHFSLACIGEENGNPLQCSCLENPRDGGAWWAAVHGVTQSRIWLKWLSSSSSRAQAQ